MDFFYLILLLTTVIDTCSTISWLEDLVSVSHPSTTIEYILYEDRVTWNEARAVCQSMGGDLAKIDSRNVLNIIIETVGETFTEDIFTHNYWIGLTEEYEGQQLWVKDCTRVAWTDNYAETWKSNEKCYKLERSDHKGKLDPCDHDNSFMCERFLDSPCSMEAPPRSYGYNETISPNKTECQLDCFLETDCLASLYTGNSTGNGTCLKVVLHTYYGDPIHISWKNCVVVTWNRTNSNPVHDNSDEPDTSCGNLTIVTTTTTASPATSGSCDCPSTTPTTNNRTDAEILEIAREIAKNLTVDPKSTSSFFRKYNSAEDTRSSSTAVGFVGLVFVLVPLALLVLVDSVGIMFIFRQNVQTLLADWRSRILPEVIVVGNEEPIDVFGTHIYA